MTHKFNTQHKHKLDNPRRRELLPPKETLLKLGLKKDDIVADIGCGIGYFSIPAAQIVGEAGKVFALDISAEMLEETKKAALTNGISNIEVVQSSETALPLPDESVSYCFISNVLHEADDKTALVREMARILKSNGKLVVIEWNDNVEDWGPPADHRLKSSDVIKFIQAEKLQPEEPIDISGCFYAIISRK